MIIMSVKSNKKTETQSTEKKHRAKYGGGSIRYNTAKDAYVVSYKGKSTTCKTKKQAEDKLREYKLLMKNVSENERKAAKQRKEKGANTVVEVVKMYRKSKYSHKQLRIRSVAREDETLNLLAKSAIANIPICELTDDMVWNNLIAPLQKTHAHSTAKKVFELLHATTRWASSRRQNIIDYDVCEEISFPNKSHFQYDINKAEAGKVKFYTLDQQKQIVERCNAKFKNGKPRTHFGAAIRLILYTGLREGEACFIRWTDCDMLNRTITVAGTVVEYKDKTTNKTVVEAQPMPKTDSSFRTIKLGNEAYEALCELQEINGNCERVISTTDGTLCSPSNIRKKMDSIIFFVAKSDPTILLVEDRVHALRHTYASNEILKYITTYGNNDQAKPNAILWVSKQLGHSSVEITNEYYNHMLDIYIRSNKIKIA